MKLTAFHVIALLCVMLTYAQEYEVSPPLPAPNAEVLSRFLLALEAIFGAGIRLQAILQNDKDENFLVSPISAAVIIGELLLGAEGEFRKQLVELLALPNSHLYENETISHYSKKKNDSYLLPYSTLHLQLSHLLKALKSDPAAGKHFILKEKSALFLDREIRLNETFKRHLKGFYKARVVTLDFAGNPVGTQKTINSWTEQNTNGLIQSILATSPHSTTSSIFANAIYFKADWRTPFSDTLNKKGVFNVDETRTVPVTYMINEVEQILYSESADFRLIALPYTNEELGMYFILPRSNCTLKYHMKAFAEKLTFRTILETIGRATRRDVVVKIPKMTLSTSFSILDLLKKYRGFKMHNVEVNSTNSLDKSQQKVDAFDNFTVHEGKDNIYLSTAAVDQSLRIDDIVQHIVITVKEKGTEAASVFGNTINYAGFAKKFIVDRPFIFFIQHELTSARLFWGTVSNPSA